jgi:AsmA protein
MKLLKWILIAVGAIVLLIAGALAFIAATFDPNKYKAQAAELVKAKMQRTLAIEGDIHLMLFPKLGVQLGKTRLSEFNSAKDFAGLDNVRVSLALIPLLSRQVVVDKIQLEGLRANLVKHGDGTTNFDDLLGGEKSGTPAKPASPAPAQRPIRLDVEGVRIRKAELTWKDEATGARYEISDFDLNTGRVAPGLPAKFDLGAKIKSSEPKLDIQFQMGGMLSADMEKQLFSVAGLSIRIVGDAAGFNGLTADVSGNAGTDLNKRTASADLVMKVAESHIKAKVDVEDLAAGRSTFDIAIDKLNVDQYLPAKKAGTATASTGGSQAEQPIDFSPIKKLDIRGSLRIGDLTVSNIKAKDVRIDLRAKNGRLDAAPLMANLYQGSVKGEMSVDANTNHLATKQALAGVSIGPLLRDLTGQDLLEGRGNLALDVNTAGTMVSAMKKALNGKARLELKDGAIKGIDLGRSLRDAKALLRGGKREDQKGATAGEKTDFSELTATFDIKNGIAHNSDFLAKSPFLRLTGEGDVNLPQSSLNYLAKVSVVASSTGQGGKEAADLAGLTVPVRASGPFTALKYNLELGPLLSDSAKQKLDEQKDVIKGKLEEKLRSKLLGKPADPAAPATDGEQPPASQPGREEKLKEKLKKLF